MTRGAYHCHVGRIWPFSIYAKKRSGLSIDVVPHSIHVCLFGSFVLLQGPEPNTLRGAEMKKDIWLSVEVKSLSLSPIKYEYHGVKHIIFQVTWHHFLSTLRFFSPVDTNLPWSPAALLNLSITPSPGCWTSLPPHSPRICNIGILERSQSTHM